MYVRRLVVPPCFRIGSEVSGSVAHHNVYLTVKCLFSSAIFV